MSPRAGSACSVRLPAWRQPQPRPHALAKAEKTTRNPGSTVTSLTDYTYDASGNTKTRRIDGDTQALNWDRRNKLTSASSPGIEAVSVIGASGKCIDVESGGTADGTPVQIYPCNETKAQQWRLTGDTVRALDKCLTTSGSKLVLATCDGNDKQKFVYRASDKSLNNPATNQCVDVPNNAADGIDLQLWSCNTTGPQQFTFDNTTTYIYDAGGNRLIEETGSARTLYLGDTEITVNKAGQALDAFRYYAGPGTTTIRRTSGKTTNHQLSVQLADHHGTATTTVDLAAGQNVTRRKSDPYGNPRGTQPGNWPGNRGFLGSGVDDTTTGLTHIGAREYEPATGRFISVDLLINIADPLQMNGYTYANGNPINQTDPSGLCSGHDPDASCRGYVPGKQYVLPYNPARPQSSGTTYVRTPWNASSFSSGPARTTTPVVVKKSGNSVVIHNVYVPTHDELIAQHKWASPEHTWAQDLQTWTRSQCAPPSMTNDKAAFCDTAGQMGLMGSTEDADILELVGLRNTYDCAVEGDVGACKDAAVDAAIDAGITLLTIGIGKAARVGFKILKQGLKKGDSRVIKCLTEAAANSFPAGTLVRLASGGTKKIEDLENGDDVLATDPESGETSAEQISAAIVTETDKQYIELTLQSASESSSVISTAHHPFWSSSTSAWLGAAELRPGMLLHTDDDHVVTVSNSRRFEARQRTYNLTVAGLHTYYVVAGQTPVLVHNSDCPNGRLSNPLPQGMSKNFVSAYDESGPGMAFRRPIPPPACRRFSRAGLRTKSAGQVRWNTEFLAPRVTMLESWQRLSPTAER